MFVTRRPHGAKPHFEPVQAKTWKLRSHIGSQEYPMPESWWKSRGVASRPCGWPPGRASPPN
jgi:hypothetical protein